MSDISGNIFELAQMGWEALRPALSETKYSDDGLFRTQVIYPEPACREALINAITHRDYSLEGRGVEIRIFDDRLEVLSPGKLLSKLTIEDLEELKGAHETRNTYVARVLREYGYIRELGEGIRRMFEIMHHNELVPPKIESPNKSFIVTLFYKHIYNEAEKWWLSNFEHLSLGREEKTVVNLGIDGRLISPKEIFEHVGIIDTDDYRQLVEDLRNKGVLESRFSSAQAQKMAREKGVSKKAIPRFEIIIPSSDRVKTSTDSSVDHSDYAKVFVAGVDWYATQKDIEDELSTYGTIVDVSIPLNQRTKKTKGFAFVEFDSEEAATKALLSTEAHYINGRKLTLKELK